MKSAAFPGVSFLASSAVCASVNGGVRKHALGGSSARLRRFDLVGERALLFSYLFSFVRPPVFCSHRV